jgi:hypothetical protein
MTVIFLHVDADLLQLGIQHWEPLVNRLKMLSQTGIYRLELSMHRLQLTCDMLQRTQYCITEGVM